MNPQIIYLDTKRTPIPHINIIDILVKHALIEADILVKHALIEVEPLENMIKKLPQ